MFGRLPVVRRKILIGVCVAFPAVALGFLPWFGMKISASGAIRKPAEEPTQPLSHVALVLGAGLRPDGQPTPVLAARVQTAAALYLGGQVSKIVMSGDNAKAKYDEVSSMKNLAVELGVNPTDVVLDYAGFRTLDSCVRIKTVFGQRQVTVVTQQFHLPRAIHLCRWAGIDTVGVAAPDPRGRSSKLKSAIREIPASAQAWIEAHVLGRSPKFLGDPIDVDNPPPEALEQPLDTAPR